MASEWSNRHHQQDDIPSMSDNPSSATAQQQAATRPDVENAIQGCTCSWCSRPRYDHQGAMQIRDHPAPWFPDNSVAPFANESLDITSPTGVTTVPNNQIIVRPVGQQAPWDRENDWYPLRYDAAGSLQPHASAAPNQVQLDMPVLDNLWRLAERYFNNPGSLVNAVHFEYSPSGRLQVVIMLDIADIL